MTLTVRGISRRRRRSQTFKGVWRRSSSGNDWRGAFKSHKKSRTRPDTTNSRSVLILEYNLLITVFGRWKRNRVQSDNAVKGV